MKVNDSNGAAITGALQPQEVQSNGGSSRSSRSGGGSDLVQLSSLSTHLSALQSDAPARTDLVSRVTSMVSNGLMSLTARQLAPQSWDTCSLGRDLLSALLAPSADHLERAVEQLSSGAGPLACHPQDLRGLLAALDPLARQAKQFYGSMLEISAPSKDAPNSQVNLCG